MFWKASCPLVPSGHGKQPHLCWCEDENTKRWCALLDRFESCCRDIICTLFPGVRKSLHISMLSLAAYPRKTPEVGNEICHGPSAVLRMQWRAFAAHTGSTNDMLFGQIEAREGIDLETCTGCLRSSRVAQSGRSSIWVDLTLLIDEFHPSVPISLLGWIANVHSKAVLDPL